MLNKNLNTRYVNLKQTKQLDFITLQLARNKFKKAFKKKQYIFGKMQ